MIFPFRVGLLWWFHWICFFIQIFESRITTLNELMKGIFTSESRTLKNQLAISWRFYHPSNEMEKGWIKKTSLGPNVYKDLLLCFSPWAHYTMPTEIRIKKTSLGPNVYKDLLVCFSPWTHFSPSILDTIPCRLKSHLRHYMVFLSTWNIDQN